MLRLFSLLLVGLVFTSLQACQSSHLTSGIEIGTKLVGAELARDKCPPAEYFYLEKGCADPGSGFPKMYATRWEVAQQNNNMPKSCNKLPMCRLSAVGSNPMYNVRIFSIRKLGNSSSEVV